MKRIILKIKVKFYRAFYKALLKKYIDVYYYDDY